MMKNILAKAYLWLLLALLYSPILIIMIFSFTEAKVLVTGLVSLPSSIARSSPAVCITR